MSRRKIYILERKELSNYGEVNWINHSYKIYSEKEKRELKQKILKQQDQENKKKALELKSALQYVNSAINLLLTLGEVSNIRHPREYECCELIPLALMHKRINAKECIFFHPSVYTSDRGEKIKKETLKNISNLEQKSVMNDNRNDTNFRFKEVRY